MEEKGSNQVDLAIENIISIFPILTKSIKRNIREKSNHSPGILFALGALNHHKILSMSELGAHLMIPKPNVTGIIDRLIADNFVERLNDPNDRRIIKVQITEKGIEELNMVKRQISQALRDKLQQLDDEKLKELIEASGKIKNILTGIFTDQL
jgi:DNA-binding MarR family transcriptional regulator